MQRKNKTQFFYMENKERKSKKTEGRVLASRYFADAIELYKFKNKVNNTELAEMLGTTRFVILSILKTGIRPNEDIQKKFKELSGYTYEFLLEGREDVISISKTEYDELLQHKKTIDTLKQSGLRIN